MCKYAVMLTFLACFSFACNSVVAARAPKSASSLTSNSTRATKQVRVECEMLACNAPLEFFCCVKGTNDYEAMIRSEVKPSDLHAALLAMGLAPGSR